jgi:hypothetical protein
MSQLNYVLPGNDIEAHVPQALPVAEKSLNKHESWASKSSALSLSVASHVSRKGFHFGIGDKMVKRTKAQINGGDSSAAVAICFVLTLVLLFISVLLPIVGVISAVVGRAFVEQQTLHDSFPAGVFDLGYVVGQFVILGLTLIGTACGCMGLAGIFALMVRSEKVPVLLKLILIPLCMASIGGIFVLPPMAAAKVIADTFGLRFKGVYAFQLMVFVMELLKDAGRKCLWGGDNNNNDKDENGEKKNGDDETCESELFSAAWRALSSFVAYVAVTNDGYLPAVVNGQGLAAVLGSVGGTILVPVFMAFQLQAQEILGQDTGNSTVPFFE